MNKGKLLAAIKAHRAEAVSAARQRYVVEKPTLSIDVACLQPQVLPLSSASFRARLEQRLEDSDSVVTQTPEERERLEQDFPSPRLSSSKSS